MTLGYSSIDDEGELVYRTDIEPLVQRIALVCKQTGLPSFMTFQVSPDSFMTTCLNEDNSDFDTIKYHRLVNESWSTDALVLKIINDAVKSGNGSPLMTTLSEFLSRLSQS